MNSEPWRSGVSAERRHWYDCEKSAALCRDAASGRRFPGSADDPQQTIHAEPTSAEDLPMWTWFVPNPWC
jgi:hypothetical protein